jgi:sensor histidine kinase regulating citrate/malate metabolism
MNAKDAILKSRSDGTLSSPGKITIKTWVNLDKTKAFLSVTDNGCGYSGTLPFTDNWRALQNDKSRGFGMCVVSETVEQLDGVIDCVSYTGKGTVFTIVLPLIPESAAVAVEQVPLPLPLVMSDRG